MYLNDNFGESIVESSHIDSFNVGVIYTQCAVRNIEEINGVVMLSSYELAYMILNAFKCGQYTTLPEYGTSLSKFNIRTMIEDGMSFEEIIKKFK